MSYLFLDFETRSFCDLVKTGAWVYSEHETTDIICLAYAIDKNPVKIWRPGSAIPEEFKTFNGKYVARNAKFEYAIYKNVMVKKYGWPERPTSTDTWIDTRALSLCAGLPGSLEGCAAALKVTEKLESGKGLINKYSKPAKEKDGSLYFRSIPPQDMDEFIKYNIQDVEADRAAFYILNTVHNVKVEKDIEALDFKQNVGGLRVDREALLTVLSAINEETKKAEAEAAALGVNVRSPKQIIEYFEKDGIFLPDTTKKTIDARLAIETDETRARILTLRQFLSKASVKKYKALLDMTSTDDRVRYFLQYYGSHTGRWAGRGFQPHNLPKSNIDAAGIEHAIERVKTGDYTRETLIDDAKSVLPGLIIPDSGHIFLMGDFAAIEARGIAWLAGQADLLDLFISGRDIYVNMAARLFNKKESDIGKKERALGKVVILACSYGMGQKTFKATCENWGIDITPTLAEKSVATYRQSYSKIYKSWYDLQDAFTRALHRHCIEYKVGQYLTVLGLRNRVEIKLPSGRVLYYHRARVDKGQLQYFNYQRKCFVYLWGGVLAENVTQALCRDILADCMLRCEAEGLNPVLHCHDEIVCNVTEESMGLFDNSAAVFDYVMNTPPEWAPGFPLKTEIEASKRYHK
jgi:DNA polymerase